MPNPVFNPEDLTSQNTNLKTLLEEVSLLEGNLDGGRKLGPGSQAVQAVLGASVNLGKPELVELTPDLFEAAKFQLSPFKQKRYEQGYRFYLLTLPLNLKPGRNIAFDMLEVEVFLGPKHGIQTPKILSFHPQPWLREVLTWQVGAKIMLDMDLDWKLSTVDIPLPIPDTLKTHVAPELGLKGGIQTTAFPFKLVEREIEASGMGSASCFWRFSQLSLQGVYDLSFQMVLEIHPQASDLEMLATVSANINGRMLTDNLKGVMRGLKNSSQLLVRQMRNGEKSVTLGDREWWTREQLGLSLASTVPDAELGVQQMEGDFYHFKMANVRELLLQGFSAKELRRFCQDTPDFQSVVFDIPEPPTSNEVVDVVMSYLEKKPDLTSQLLSWVADENPSRYKFHGPYEF